MLDLFAIAKGNGIAIDEGFRAALAGLPPEHAALVKEFALWVEAKALISVNVSLWVIGELLNGRTHQNMYEWAQEQERLSGRAAQEALQERLKGHYERRIAFDRAFEKGERFRYGALNAGGAGLTTYAPYCVVLTKRFQVGLSPGVRQTVKALLTVRWNCIVPRKPFLARWAPDGEAAAGSAGAQPAKE